MISLDMDIIIYGAYRYIYTPWAIDDITKVGTSRQLLCSILRKLSIDTNTKRHHRLSVPIYTLPAAMHGASHGQRVGGPAVRDRPGQDNAGPPGSQAGSCRRPYWLRSAGRTPSGDPAGWRPVRAGRPASQAGSLR